MNILELAPYYYPEQISSSHLTEDLEDAYIAAGFEIKVYAPVPTRGISEEVYEKYKNKLYEERKDGHIQICRFPMMREGKNAILRILRYFLVHWKQYRKAIRETDVSVISAASTPPTQGLLCALVKKKLSKKHGRKVPMIFALHDVFPDSLVHAGMTKEGSLVWKIGRLVEDKTYSYADEIIVISEDIRQNILAKGVPGEKIHVIHNWIDCDAVKSVPFENNRTARELGITDEKFKVVYAGNLGKAQGIQVILDAAEQLKALNTIEFLIFGNGVEEAAIRSRIQEKNLMNVRLFLLQPQDRVSEVYSLGDVCIVACKKGTGRNAFPSKTASILAAGTPVLAAFDSDGELCRLLQTSHAGVCVEPENPVQMAEAIISLANHPEQCIQMGHDARKLAENVFKKELCTDQYVTLIKAMCKEPSLVRSHI